jgi:Uma2 family endonuclease
MMAGNASTDHQRICGFLYRKLGNYLEGKTCQVFCDLNIYLHDEDGQCKNVFQPDVMVGCRSEKFSKRGYEGAPEFIAEVISKSTASHDYITKHFYYMLYGVKEYWVVDLFQNKVTVYINGGEGLPEVHVYSFDDEIRPRVFEDFVIDFKEAKPVYS